MREKGPKRRTRRVMTGRTWICVYCDKCYFKSNSLLFHVRQKHNKEVTFKSFINSQLTRARPQKDHNDSESMSNSNKQDDVDNRSKLLEREDIAGGPVLEPLANFSSIARQLELHLEPCIKQLRSQLDNQFGTAMASTNNEGSNDSEIWVKISKKLMNSILPTQSHVILQ